MMLNIQFQELNYLFTPVDCVIIADGYLDKRSIATRMYILLPAELRIGHA